MTKKEQITELTRQIEALRSEVAFLRCELAAKGTTVIYPSTPNPYVYPVFPTSPQIWCASHAMA